MWMIKFRNFGVIGKEGKYMYIEMCIYWEFWKWFLIGWMYFDYYIFFVGWIFLFFLNWDLFFFYEVKIKVYN